MWKVSGVLMSRGLYDGIMDFLTGTGLAASAGLNAYIPLLVLGFLDRYTQFVNLASGFDWLSNSWVLIILSVLLALEVVADKIPAADTVNDFIQTIVRPTSGGIVFGSTAVSHIAGFSMVVATPSPTPKLTYNPVHGSPSSWALSSPCSCTSLR